MPRRSSPHPVDRLLVVAPNWLGDVVMTTPLLDWLQQVRLGEGAPRFRLILAVRSAWAPLFAGDARVDELVVTGRDGLRGRTAHLIRLRRPEPTRVRPQAELQPSLVHTAPPASRPRAAVAFASSRSVSANARDLPAVVSR